MTDPEVADLLEAFAAKVRRLPISLSNPHAFAESKSELAGEMMRRVRDLRVAMAPVVAAAKVGTIRPGTRTIGNREVRVERRRA